MEVTLRGLFAVLLALAMTFAPLGVPAMAEAVMPASHHGMMADDLDCHQQKPDQTHQAADKNCCVAMCVAVVIPAGSAELRQYHAARERPASDLDRRGFLGEIATPPPKSA